MDDNLIKLVSIIALGVFSQWLAWLARIPSILLLLLVGFLMGPILGFIRPEHLLGDLLHPLISLSVAVILFEGGLSLKITELKSVGRVVGNMLSLGVLVTFALASFGAWAFLDLGWATSLMLGAILVVTGPTVIVPLLRHMRLSGKVGPVLKWEAMMIDPIGVILAVLVFEAILAGGVHDAAGAAVLGFVVSIGLGTAIGFAFGGLLVMLMQRYWIPDFLQSAVALMTAVLAYGCANHFFAESGLVSVTVMGALLANQKFVSVKHIIEFKENLRVLLISSLFIILAAGMQLEAIYPIQPSFIIFCAFLILIVRPASVFLATLGSDLNWREKVFLSWMAPRGIVAAAGASLFAISLIEMGVEDANQIVPVTFMVIVATVSFYGLTAPHMAYLLKVAKPNPQGVLILGAQPWSQQIAIYFKVLGLKVLMVDTNQNHVVSARKNGLAAVTGNILSESFTDRLDLNGIGYFLGLVPNDEVNALAALHFAKLFGSSSVYQLQMNKDDPHSSLSHLHGRILFGKNISYEYIESLHRKNEAIHLIHFSENYDVASYKEEFKNRSTALFWITSDGQLRFPDEKEEQDIKDGDHLIVLLRE